jgi:hypothetical protein
MIAHDKILNAKGLYRFQPFPAFDPSIKDSGQKDSVLLSVHGAFIGLAGRTPD